MSAGFGLIGITVPLCGLVSVDGVVVVVLVLVLLVLLFVCGDVGGVVVVVVVCGDVGVVVVVVGGGIVVALI